MGQQAQGPAQARGSALARREDGDAIQIQIQGTYSRPADIQSRLEQASAQAHLVTPASACTSVPEGCEVALSTVRVDVANETYDVGGGKRGLAKIALDRIGAAAGISWDPQQSGRLDDGRDPHYCAWQAVGTYRHFDGAEVRLVGTKEMDLRQGSAQVEALWERYQSARARWERGGRHGYEPKSPEAQIREMRLHIVGHAETKARLRAVRAIGIRTSYTPDELHKPFVVARLTFTGHTSDPELRAMFASKRADAMLGGTRALYGSGAPAQALPAAPRRVYTAAPPVGAGGVDEDELAAAPQPAPRAAIPQSATPPAPESSPQQAPPGEAAGQLPVGQPAPAQRAPAPGGDLYMPSRRGAPRVRIVDAEDRDLEYWAGRLARALAEGTSQRPDLDRAGLEAMRAEIARRRGEALPGTEPVEGELETDRGDDPDAY
jgi:hypothetical protein